MEPRRAILHQVFKAMKKYQLSEKVVGLRTQLLMHSQRTQRPDAPYAMRQYDTTYPWTIAAHMSIILIGTFDVLCVPVDAPLKGAKRLAVKQPPRSKQKAQAARTSEREDHPAKLRKKIQQRRQRSASRRKQARVPLAGANILKTHQRCLHVVHFPL